MGIRTLWRRRIAAEIASQIRLLRAAQAELAQNAEAREAAYPVCDPDGLARPCPVNWTSGGRSWSRRSAARTVPNGAPFKAYTGLTPKASETGDIDRKGQPMSKAGAAGCGPS